MKDPLVILPYFEQHHPNTYLLWIQLCPFQKTLYIVCYKPIVVPAEPVAKGAKNTPKEIAPPLDPNKQWFFDKVDILLSLIAFLLLY